MTNRRKKGSSEPSKQNNASVEETMGPWRSRRVPIGKLEQELNICAANGYKVTHIEFPDELGGADEFSDGPIAVVLARKNDEATNSDELLTLREIVTDAARMRCLAADAFVDEECGDCVSCRARVCQATYIDDLLDEDDELEFEDASVEDAEEV